MKVVIDTNVLLVSFPNKSRYRPIFNSIINSDVFLIITNSIYLEYVEILHCRAKREAIEIFEKFVRSAENIINPAIYYSWNLITVDPDDNKFTDAYIAANADYLITNDAHFNEVKKIPFPPVKIVSADEFLEILKGLG